MIRRVAKVNDEAIRRMIDFCLDLYSTFDV
ncbi:Uncharacterised protein [uncultured archaeon]|nr:Uncharacterised protein [uncultured archaeon]